MTYVFAAIGVPGATSTSVGGVNDFGLIAGSYTDHAGHSHGFVDNHGSFTTIDVPGAAGTVATGLNNFGEIVGHFFDKSGHEYGFLDNHGHFTTLDVPGSLATDAAAINDWGQVAGTYQAPASGPSHDGLQPQPTSNVFEYSGGAFTTLVHGSNYGIGGISAPRAGGINDRSQVVGTTERAPANFPYGWLYDHGTTRTVPDPSALPQYTIAFGANGINNLGQVVGYTAGTATGASSENRFGYVDTYGHVTQVIVPGATDTTVNGLNDWGLMVGDSSKGAFVAAPSAVLLTASNVLGPGTPQFITG